MSNELIFSMDFSPSKLSLQLIALVASTFAAYEILNNNFGLGLGFAISWVILIIAKNRMNKNLSDTE